MPMDLSFFKANLLGGGARPNQFRVTLNFPSNATAQLSNLAGTIGNPVVSTAVGALANLVGAGGPSSKIQFLCNASAIPSFNLGQIEVPYRGRSLKIPGDRTFDDWNLTIINDTDFALRNAFETWSNAINSVRGNIGATAWAALCTSGTVEQLDRAGKTLKNYIFEGCWPSTIGSISLDWGSNNSIEEFDVTLAYQWFTTDTTT